MHQPGRFLWALAIGVLFLPTWAAGSTASSFALDAKIVFSRGDINVGTAIWTVNGDGTDLVQVTRPPKRARDDEPAWSPDRSQIAFVRAVVVGEDFRGDYIYREHLTVMSANGVGLRRVAIHAHDPAWSADGRQIVFVRGYAEAEWIWTIKPDGSGAHRLAPGGHPAWSPNGRQIVFDRWTGDRTETFVMSANGGAQRKLVLGFKGDSDVPAWSPDGQRIAFLGCRCAPGIVDVSLYVVSRTGANVRRLVGGVASKDANTPKWSPDGSKLLVERGRSGGTASLFVVGLPGGARRVATDTSYPDWSPDGRSIAFAKPLRDLRVVSIGGGGPSRRIARQEARDIDW